MEVGLWLRDVVDAGDCGKVEFEVEVVMAEDIGHTMPPLKLWRQVSLM